MSRRNYDFSGWATRNDLKCGDGRVIRKDAFKDNDGQTVPLVWNHQHNDPLNVLGHALLENREEGVYAYCSFNDTDNAKEVKKIVQHGDVAALSIYANKLKQNGADVIHGAIREVSLVLAGANPGAFIDAVLEHNDEDGDAMIYSYCSGDSLNLEHSEDLDPDANEGEEMADVNEMSLDEIRDEYENMTDEQKEAVHFLIGQALEDAGVDFDEEDDEEDDEDYDEEDYEGEEDMKHNVFDNDARQESNFLSHSDMENIFRNAKRLGSLREAIDEFTDNAGVELMHSTFSTDDTSADNYATNASFGLKNIDYLFPEYKSLNVPPAFISRNMEWVSRVMGSVHHTPFSRIKSMFADITADEARAKGYIKGNLKKEEVFTLLKRATDPQTVYKKQKMDRDDVTDITDFDVVAWIRKEMRMMLDEEIARAILIGDGRLSDDPDKISTDHVRPVAFDADLYTIKVRSVSNPKEQIKDILRARKLYKGSGNPVFYTTEDVLTEMLLLEDDIGHPLYKTEAELATKLRVSSIVTVPVMEGLKDANNNDVYGIIVNLQDYNVGADKGGAINNFEDFDIDYNQMKYLIETRISGALIKPYSAMVITSGKGAQGATGATGATGSTN